MKNYLLLIFCFLAIIISCKQKTKSVEKAHQANQTIENNTIDTIGTADRYFNYQNTIIQTDFYDTVFQNFSSENAEDCFTFYMPSGNINETKSTIRITTKIGKVIYEKTFTTSDIETYSFVVVFVYILLIVLPHNHLLRLQVYHINTPKNC